MLLQKEFNSIVCNTRHNFYTLAYHSISWHLQISPFTLDKLTPSYNNDLPVNFFCYFLDIPTTLQNWGGQNLIQLCTYMRSTDMYCKLCLIILFLWHIGGFLKRPNNFFKISKYVLPILFYVGRENIPELYTNSLVNATFDSW